MIHRFAVRDRVRNKQTNEDGRITSLIERNGVAMYMVTVPNARGSWMLGSVEAEWLEADLELSNNRRLL